MESDKNIGGRPINALWHQLSSNGSPHKEKSSLCQHCRVIVNHRGQVANVRKHFTNHCNKITLQKRCFDNESSLLPHVQEIKKQKTLPDIFSTVPSEVEQPYLQKAISLWIYETGLPLNTCDNDSFRRMLGIIRPGLQPPSRKVVAGSHLNEFHGTVKELLMNELNDGKTMYTLGTDGWTDINGNSITNYMLTSPKSQFLLESGSLGAVSHNADNLSNDIIRVLEPHDCGNRAS